MQFHLNGFRPGDPLVAEPSSTAPAHGDAAPSQVDVLIMDVLAVTDFPDIRYKAVVQSANGGNLLVIPREGGYLVRLYVEMDKLAEQARAPAATSRSSG